MFKRACVCFAVTTIFAASVDAQQGAGARSRAGVRVTGGVPTQSVRGAHAVVGRFARSYRPAPAVPLTAGSRHGTGRSGVQAAGNPVMGRDPGTGAGVAGNGVSFPGGVPGRPGGNALGGGAPGGSGPGGSGPGGSGPGGRGPGNYGNGSWWNGGFGGPGAPFRHWWGGGVFPVQIPLYAPLYGVTPGYFPTFRPKPSTAKVVIHTGPANTKYTARSRFPESIEAAVDRLHENPLAGDPTKLGVERFRARDYHGAAEAFRRAAPLDPDNGLPRFGHAFASFALGDYEGASWSLRRGLDLLPDWASSGQDLGAWYQTPLDLEDHLQALRSHCRVRPDDHEAKAVLGYISFFTGDVDGAEQVFTELDAAREDDPLPGHFLAELAKIRGK